MKSDYDMSRVHQANLTILKEIDRICRKYNIQWSKATEKDRDFVTEMTRVTYQSRIGVPKEQIHFFGPRI